MSFEMIGRVVRAATGGEYGDGDRVTDVVAGGYNVGTHDSPYAEPGYQCNGAAGVVVLGNWNPKRFPHGDDAPLTREENLGPRLANVLERLGCDLEWSDEWTRCGECGRLVRTSEDSYTWRPFYAWLNDCEIVCGDCIREDPAGYLEQITNNPNVCVTFDLDLSADWTQWAPSDPHRYQSGWHEGMDDDPRKVLAEIHREHPDADVVFMLDENSQFHRSFSAWTRDESVTHDEEDAGEDY